MSNMLEQAIIDAQALKEAALKNAETLVLEKYSSQLKDAVDTLLEQDDPMASPGVPDAAEAAPQAKPKIIDDIPLAATHKGDDQIELDLDQLMEDLSVLNESFRFNGDTHNDEELFEHNLAEIEEADLEEMIEEADDDDKDDDNVEDAAGTSGVASKKEDALEEDLLSQIAEKLSVDISPQKSGWAGTPTSMIELAEEEILALEQDSVVREKKAALRKAVQQLDSVNEGLSKTNENLNSSLDQAKEQLVKMRDAVLTLNEKLEHSNLQNAKLLYQNKALTSDSLNERQKQKLVEAISNADTIEEAKVIFDTLHSTVGSTSRKKQPKSLGEAVQRPSSVVLSNRKQSSKGQRQSPTLERWKFLAGIDK